MPSLNTKLALFGFVARHRRSKSTRKDANLYGSPGAVLRSWVRFPAVMGLVLVYLSGRGRRTTGLVSQFVCKEACLKQGFCIQGRKSVHLVSVFIMVATEIG